MSKEKNDYWKELTPEEFDKEYGKFLRSETIKLSRTIDKKKSIILDLTSKIEEINILYDKELEKLDKAKLDFQEYSTSVNAQIKELDRAYAARNQFFNEKNLLPNDILQFQKQKEEIMEQQEQIGDQLQEINGQLAELNEQKRIATETREAQRSSYYRPTETEVQFFTTKRGDFLEEYEQCGSVVKAAESVGVKPSLIQYYRKKFPDFADDLAIAYDLFRDKLDGTLIDRAINGQDKPSFYKGEVVDTYNEKNDTLMIAAVRGHIPEKYDRGKLDRIEGAKQNNVVINMVSFKDAKSEDYGTVKDVGVVKFVGEHGDIKRITGDKMSAHELANNPDEVIIDYEMEDMQHKSAIDKVNVEHLEKDEND